MSKKFSVETVCGEDLLNGTDVASGVISCDARRRGGHTISLDQTIKDVVRKFIKVHFWGISVLVGTSIEFVE